MKDTQDVGLESEETKSDFFAMDSEPRPRSPDRSFTSPSEQCLGSHKEFLSGTNASSLESNQGKGETVKSMEELL